MGAPFHSLGPHSRGTIFGPFHSQGLHNGGAVGAPCHSLGLPSCLPDLHVFPFSKREASLVFCLSPLSLVIPVSLVQLTY